MAAERGSKVIIVRSLLPYQILLYLHGYYSVFYTVCELAMFIFKGETLPYPPGNLAAEVIIVLLLAGIEIFRLFFGKKGNLSERVQPVAVSLGLSVFCVLGNVFLLIWQTYVLRAELILISIQLILIALEMLFGLIAIISFNRATPY